MLIVKYAKSKTSVRVKHKEKRIIKDNNMPHITWFSLLYPFQFHIFKLELNPISSEIILMLLPAHILNKIYIRTIYTPNFFNFLSISNYIHIFHYIPSNQREPKYLVYTFLDTNCSKNVIVSKSLILTLSTSEFILHVSFHSDSIWIQ